MPDSDKTATVRYVDETFSVLKMMIAELREELEQLEDKVRDLRYQSDRDRNR